MRSMRGLAAAIGAQQAHELAPGHMQAHIAHDVRGRRLPAQLLHAEFRRHASSLSLPL
jgi:hypothetical protein